MNKIQKKLINRRDAIKLGIAGTTGLIFTSPLKLLAQEAPAKAKAKAVIQIWLWGGASHLDTFDPKPNAGYDYCGPFNKAISTNVDGIQINPLLPLLAKQADKYSIIRSMTHGNNSHETAAYMVQTGHAPDRLVYPSAGAVVSMFKGYDNGYKGLVPPYIVMTELQGRFSESGFLGSKYKPFATGGDPAKTPFAVEGIIAEGISDKRQLGRRELLHSLDSLGKAMPENPLFKEYGQSEENAYNMIFGDARKLFDLSSEKDETRESYGRNTFGQSCLMARKLVEAGVPYVTINYKGWDTHKQHFETMNRKLPEFDKGLSSLLNDLNERGLLDSTIIWCSGEFGRTPKIQWEAPWNGGRGHYGNCFCSLVAGGGFRGGKVVGESDGTGAEAVKCPIYPKDLIASMYELLGIDPEGQLPNPMGLKTQVMPESKRLKEIM
ncbi:MAG: hypothetical protein A2Y10_03590 [Planctomycetes bacterium GWF2_41_51]|nr:MAG: hypothetical protein A2Y10_03590 [Planctomycetes bacterium GWF2_41_51]HBG28826.1 DUF1501 domain-containing protein [Phycisphaerales bacterium]